MDGYFPHNQLQSQLPNQQQPQRRQTPQAQGQLQGPNAMNISGSAAQNVSTLPVTATNGILGNSPIGGGDMLDDIVRDNHNAILRRRSMPPHAFNSDVADGAPRRMSSTGSGEMMNFGGNDDLGNYQFNQQMPSALPALDTTGMNIAEGLSNQLGDYMTDPAEYSTLSPDMMGNMIPSTFANMNMGAIGNESPTVNMFPGQTSMPGSYAPGQLGNMRTDFSVDMNVDDAQLNSPTANGNAVMMEPANSLMTVPQQLNALDPANQQANMSLDPQLGDFNPGPLSRHVSSTASGVSPHRGTSSTSLTTHPSSASDVTTPATGPPPPPRDAQEKTIYSKSGFDMLKALWLVATRKDPKIHLGAVDMSCAFVVCDVTMNDCPIIYVSDNFQNLTGYSRHEIVGQNCRFLQSPDGKVEAGSKREFVDDGAVFNLKKMIHEGREVQQSLINYRKGGKPFLNLLTMIPIPWDTDEIRYFIGFQIDLVECPDAISAGQEVGGVKVNYKHSDIGQYIWSPPTTGQWEGNEAQTLDLDDVSTMLQQFGPKAAISDWHKQQWDKMLLENTDDVVHVLSLKGLFLYISPSCKRVLEYDPSDLVGNSLSTVCHPSDIVPVTRELKDATAGTTVDIVFRIRRKNSGYTWFESHGALLVEQGKGRKSIILVGRKRPVIALSRSNLEANGGIGDSELWTKLSTSGMFLFVSSNIRSLLDLQPESLVGTSIQDLMRKESRPEFGRAIEKARRGKTVTCKHEVQNRRGQVLQAQTVLYPGDAVEGQKPSFLLAQTKLLKASSRSIAPASAGSARSRSLTAKSDPGARASGQVSQPAGGSLALGTQDVALASEDNMFDELRTTKCSSWQFELRQMEKVNRILAEELGGLLSNKKKRKRRKGSGNVVRDCANCHTRSTPEWRRGPSGQRDLCNSCGLRWAKQTGRVSPRNSSRGAKDGAGDSNSKKSASPIHSSPLHKEMSAETPNPHATNGNGGSNSAPISSNKMSSSSGTNLSTGMPPPSHSSLSNAIPGSSMASIREERESSQHI